MGFIKEVYSNNRAGLVVAFGRGESSDKYFAGDNIEEAMKHFNLYLKGYEMYVKTEDEKAIEQLGINAEDAAEFRSTVNEIIGSLTDEQALAAPVLFPVWQAEVEYKAGDRVRYDGKLYKVIQDHNSQLGWEPIVAASLFAVLLIDEETDEILEWVQPDSTNAYSIGDKVLFEGATYESLIDNNVWSPADYPNGWKEIIIEE